MLRVLAREPCVGGPTPVCSLQTDTPHRETRCRTVSTLRLQPVACWVSPAPHAP